MKIERSRNVLIETENYFLELFDFETGGPLVVTFEAAGAPRDRPEKYRDGWGAKLLRRWGVSNLSVKPKRVEWYRQPDLRETILKLRADGEFDGFSRIITYGGSMGGYGALAYADAFGADTVLSINPQTTLDKTLVPWETRFPLGRKQDWTDPVSDAATQCVKARKVYVVVDRWFDLDWWHVRRLGAENLTVLNVPFVGHRMPEHMVLMKAALPILQGVIADEPDLVGFYRDARRRRNLKRYFNMLAKRPRVRNSETFRAIVADYRSKSPLKGAE